MYCIFEDTHLNRTRIIFFNLFRIKYKTVHGIKYSKHFLKTPTSQDLRKCNNLDKKILKDKLNKHYSDYHYTVDYVKKNLEFGTYLKKNKYCLKDIVTYFYSNNYDIENNDLKIISSYAFLFSKNYQNNFLKKIFRNFYFFFAILKYIKYFCIIYIINIITLLFFNQFKIPNIIYLRKKNSPDPVWLNINKIFNKENKNLNINNILLNFGFQKKKSDFIPINYYKTNQIAYFKIFVISLKKIINFRNIFIKSGLPYSSIHRYAVDIFNSLFIANLTPKIFLGSLVDKPIFILLYNNKINSTFYSLSESFHYPPINNFDYVYSDFYFYMHKIEQETLNRSGGKIKKFIKIPFFRDNTENNRDKLISNDLLNRFREFKKIIICASININSTFLNLSPWGQTELNAFIMSIEKLAKKNISILFILKEKKNEFFYLDNEILRRLDKMNNIFIIRSINPKKEKLNKFEHLISFSDMLISMSYRSTTIYEFLSQNKPVIAINDFETSSFLREYNIETSSSDLETIFNYWNSLTTKNRNLLIEKMKSELNLKDYNGLIELNKYIK